MNADRDFECLQRYMDGTASAEDIQRLNARLRDDAVARRQFMELLNLDSALGAVSEAVDVKVSPNPGRPKRRRRRSTSRSPYVPCRESMPTDAFPAPSHSR